MSVHWCHYRWSSLLFNFKISCLHHISWPHCTLMDHCKKIPNNGYQQRPQNPARLFNLSFCHFSCLPLTETYVDSFWGINVAITFKCCFSQWNFESTVCSAPKGSDGLTVLLINISPKYYEAQVAYITVQLFQWNLKKELAHSWNLFEFCKPFQSTGSLHLVKRLSFSGNTMPITQT